MITLHAHGINADSSNYVLQEINPQKLHSYISTHGEMIEGLFAPYASEYCSIYDIDTSQIVKNLFGSMVSYSSNDYPKYISSYRYLCGNWTYFISNSVCIYEIIKFRDST